MKRLTCALVVLAALLLAVADDAVNKELKSMQGKWKAVSLEFAGKAFPKENVPDFTFVVGADGKCKNKMPQGESDVTITIDPKKTPKTIDNFHETGPEKGKKQFGIYKLDGDKFTVCMSRTGAAEANRPKDFATKDTTNVVFVFERVKGDK